MAHKVMNFGSLLTQTARRLPQHPGVIQGERAWSWAELDRRSDAAVAALRRRGFGAGDRVIILSYNDVTVVEALYAAFKLGGIAVPVNFRLTSTEIAYMAEASGATAMLYGADFAAHADAAQAGQPALRLLLSTGVPRAGETAWDALASEPFEPAEAVPADVEHDTPLWFFYTSGTTGRPKAAMLTHGQMMFVVTNFLADLLPGITEADASLAVAPLSHGAGIHALAVVARGAPTVLLATERFDIAEAWRLIEKHRVSNLFTVPSIVNTLIDHPLVDQVDHSALRYVIYAGAPMYRADQKRALQKLGKVLVQYYGMAEVTGSMTVLPAHLHSIEDDGSLAPIGTVGYPRTGIDLCIMAPNGAILPPGEQGEVCVRGGAVFAGYYQNPEANAKSFAHGWFHTGDLGQMDARGFLTLTGRASDMYISGGSNVYPREVEEVLLTHPAIAECAIVGVPSQRWGESGIAVLVLRPGEDLDEAGARSFLEGKVARYKQPARFVFWEALPKSGYGKVPKPLIRQGLKERGEDRVG
jgi:fatty-acyl-CoA synthase